MRLPILILIAAASLALPASAQNSDHNGMSVQTNNATDYTSYLPLNSFSALVFDSVRALTELNVTNQADAFPWISADGLRLYYTNANPGGSIKYTERNNLNSYFSPPVTLTIPNLIEKRSIWLSNDELDAYISTGSDLYFTQRTLVTSPFSTPVPISLSGGPYGFVIGPSLNNAQNELFAYVNVFSSNTTVIRLFSRDSANSFIAVQDLSLPAGYITGTGNLSKDDLTLYLSAYTSSNPNHLLYTMTRTHPADSFSVSTFQQVPNVSNSSVLNIQPSVSANEDVLVFVRNITGQWLDNELYMASQSGQTSVFEQSVIKSSISISPNPSSGIFRIIVSPVKEINTEIYNILGVKIISKINFVNGIMEVDLTAHSKGMYFIKIKDSMNSTVRIEKLIKN
jgi:hypothetical protein